MNFSFLWELFFFSKAYFVYQIAFLFNFLRPSKAPFNFIQSLSLACSQKRVKFVWLKRAQHFTKQISLLNPKSKKTSTAVNSEFRLISYPSCCCTQTTLFPLAVAQASSCVALQRSWTEFNIAVSCKAFPNKQINMLNQCIGSSCDVFYMQKIPPKKKKSDPKSYRTDGKIDFFPFDFRAFRSMWSRQKRFRK